MPLTKAIIEEIHPEDSYFATIINNDVKVGLEIKVDKDHIRQATGMDDDWIKGIFYWKDSKTGKKHNGYFLAARIRYI